MTENTRLDVLYIYCFFVARARSSTAETDTASVTFTVTITDVNDNTPTFTAGVFCKAISSNSTQGEQINNFSQLHYYAQYKSEFKFEKYLQVIENEKFRKTLTAFRVYAHNLEIERGRYRDENRERRLCNLCNLKQVESEYHFLLICPFYAALRQSYLGPSMLKFINIMDCSSRNFIIRLSKYVYFAMSRRSDAINGISDS